MMPNFTSMTFYSLKMFLRDRRTWFWSLFIPVFIMIIFGLMDFDQMGKVNLGVADQSGSEMSAQIIETLDQVDIFSVDYGSRSDLEESLKEGDLDLILVIPENFQIQYLLDWQENPLVFDLLTSGEQSEVSGTGVLLVNQVLSQFEMRLAGQTPLFSLDYQVMESRDLGYIDFIIPGVLGMMIMQLGVIGVASTIVKFREEGVLKRMRVTPVNPSVFLFGMVVSRLLLLFAQAGLIIGMGYLFFDLSLQGNIFYIGLVIFLGSLVFLNIGFAISGRAKTMSTAMSMAQLIQMPMMFLSGVYFSREAFPEWLQRVTNFLPLTYLADALRETMINQANLFDIRKDLLALTLWMIGGFFLAVRVFSWNEE